MNQKNINLNELFKDDIKDPFFYNLYLEKCHDINILFNKIKDIFIKGLIIHAGNEEKNSIDIDNITEEHIQKIGKYLLSIGIQLNYKKIDAKEKDYIYCKFLYDIEKIKEIDIQVGMDWITKYIHSIKINICNNQELLNKIKDITKKHIYANFLLKINSPIELKDYAIFFEKQNETHIISFDLINIGYSKNSLKCKSNINNEKSWQS